MDQKNPGTITLRPAAAAAYTGLSTGRLAKLRLFGGGPEYIKIGRSVLYRRSDLDHWLSRNRRRSTADTGAQADAA